MSNIYCAKYTAYMKIHSIEIARHVTTTMVTFTVYQLGIQTHSSYYILQQYPVKSIYNKYLKTVGTQFYAAFSLCRLVETATRPIPITLGGQ